MISKLILEQREEFDKTFHYDFCCNIYECDDKHPDEDKKEIKDFILSSHLSIIDSEITRLEGKKKDIYTHDDKVILSNCEYNQALEEEISYLKKQRAEILAGNK